MGREVRPSKSEGGMSGNSMIWENGSSAARTNSGLNGEVEAESNADWEKFVGTRPSQMIGAFAAADGSKGGIGLAVDKRKEEKSETSGSVEVSIVERSGRRDWLVRMPESNTDSGAFKDFLHTTVGARLSAHEVLGYRGSWMSRPRHKTGARLLGNDWGTKVRATSKIEIFRCCQDQGRRLDPVRDSEAKHRNEADYN